MKWSEQRWFLGCDVLTAGHGGIARVARMTARALAGAVERLDMLALHDDGPIEVAGRRSSTVKGSKLAYAARCHEAALNHDVFLYDQVGLARAHPRLPGLRRPYGVWIHGVEVWDHLSAARTQALKRARFVLANSRFTLDKFQQIHGPLQNATVCHLATEQDEPPPPRSQTIATPTALLIGRCDRENFRKGHAEVIRAWDQVVQAIPTAELLLVGGGDGFDHLRSLVSASRVRDRIKVLGFVPEEHMDDIWRRAQLFVQPSWKEGFGLVYVEAMRQGLPVIASRQDAGQEINQDSVTGFNVDLNDFDTLAERIIMLLEDSDLSRQMGEMAQMRWREHFRFSAFNLRLKEALQQVCID